jgi:dihydropyrimidinase
MSSALPACRCGCNALNHGHIRDGADYTPYEGMEIKGWPVLTMIRGKTVVRDGILTGNKSHGTYLRRELSAHTRG